MAKSSPNQEVVIRTVAPFTIEATTYERFKELAEDDHRTVTAQLRFLIDRHIAEANKEAA
jgi:hypothetical protein